MNYMADPAALSIIGSFIAFAGTIVLAFSLGGVIAELKLSVKAIYATITSIVAGGDIYLFEGWEGRVSRAITKVGRLTYLGLFLVVISLLFQGYSIYVANVQAKNGTTLVKEIKVSLDDSKQKIALLQGTIEKLSSKIKRFESNSNSKKQSIK